MSVDARTNLATQQAHLVRALTGQADMPSRFDTIRLRATAAGLVSKRLRSVARAWPDLAEALGDRYGSLFADFAAIHGVPDRGGPLGDGRAFAHWLAERDELPQTGRVQAMAFDLRFKESAGGWARRWIALRWCVLQAPRRLVVGLRLPCLGERWLTVRLP